MSDKLWVVRISVGGTLLELWYEEERSAQQARQHLMLGHDAVPDDYGKRYYRQENTEPAACLVVDYEREQEGLLVVAAMRQRSQETHMRRTAARHGNFGGNPAMPNAPIILGG